MTIEQQVADLTTATTALLNAVNVSKGTLDQKVIDATAQAVIATAQAVAAAASETNAATSAANSTNSANLAANAVVSQLTSIKTQTEAARDQALAGLGAADNSQILFELTQQLAYVTDMALLAAREGMATTATVGTYDASIANVVYQLTALADLAGQAAKAVAGGDVLLRAGTAPNPSLQAYGDPNTGLFFPAADTAAMATGGVERWRTDGSGFTGFATSAPSCVVDINDNHLRVRTAKTPASATAAGNAGDMCWDAAYIYVCVATNSWKRTAIAAW